MPGVMEKVRHGKELNRELKKKLVDSYSLTIDSLCDLEQVMCLPGSHFPSCEVKELVEWFTECLPGCAI